jgi:Uma2 family endonuclease
MPSQVHQAIILYILQVLRQFVLARGLGVVSFAGLRVKMSDDKFREPDVVFMRKQNDHRRNNDYWEGADLVMEVVSSNREHDLVTKRREYAEAGIPEYWIIDPQLRTITVLTLVDRQYVQHGIFADDVRAQSVLLPGFEVAVVEVFNQ